MTDHELPHFERGESEEKASTTLELIDCAVASAERAAHCCDNKAAREHFEFALALLRESWIAESGQEARSAAQVVANVREAFDLFAAVFDLKGGN